MKRAWWWHTGHTGSIDGIELDLRYVECDGGRLQTGLHYFQRAGQYRSNRSPTSKWKDTKQLDRLTRTREQELQLFTPNDWSCDTGCFFVNLAIIKLVLDVGAGILAIFGTAGAEKKTPQWGKAGNIRNVCVCWRTNCLQNVLSARTDKCVDYIRWLKPSGVDLQQVLAELQQLHFNISSFLALTQRCML